MARRTGAPRDTLAARLALWSAPESSSADSTASTRPVRVPPDQAGRELYPVILTLMRWGDRHLAGDDGPPLVLEHHCGHRLVTQVVCEACGEAIDARDTRPLTAGHDAMARRSRTGKFPLPRGGGFEQWPIGVADEMTDERFGSPTRALDHARLDHG